VCYQVEVSASDWSLVQRNPTECDVSWVWSWSFDNEALAHKELLKKVKWSRYRPCVAQRLGRVIALLFHGRGTRRGCLVSSTPRPHFTPGEDPVPIVQEAGWAPGSVWTGEKSRPHRYSIPDRPARSQSLYWTTRGCCAMEKQHFWSFTGVRGSHSKGKRVGVSVLRWVHNRYGCRGRTCCLCLADGGSSFFRTVTIYVPNYTAKLIVTVLEFFWFERAETRISLQKYVFFWC